MAKGVAGANDKFAEPLERLENAAALLGEVERLAEAGEWTPLYDRLTPYVLGMEPLPGLKGMKKRLTGEHKAAVKTRADEAAGLFGQILELISCSEDEAEADRLAALPRLRLRGLMCIPEPAPNFDAEKALFMRAKAQWDALNAQGLALDTLSMGMSADLEAAVAAGATLVRVGTAIFGVRPPRAA